MVRAILINNLGRKVATPVPSTTTLREMLEAEDFPYQTGLNTLDGAPLSVGDMDKTFEELGISETCYFANAAKTNNA